MLYVEVINLINFMLIFLLRLGFCTNASSLNTTPFSESALLSVLSPICVRVCAFVSVCVGMCACVGVSVECRTVPSGDFPPRTLSPWTFPPLDKFPIN